jgi:exopolyphosphatase/guanosine-5'-triphosphate,3'-diphosphate pyrophosphatase
MVQALGRRYGVDAAHIRKVAQLAVMLFDGLMTLHRLPPAQGRLLEAAAYLYNIGHYVNEARHHRHSLYLVENSDLPGFDDRERAIIANVCRYHRKSMPQPSHEAFQALDADGKRAVIALAPLLRLAVALDQSQEQKVARVDTFVDEKAVQVRLYSDSDVDNEQWHASQVSNVFVEAYGLPLQVRIGK